MDKNKKIKELEAELANIKKDKRIKDLELQIEAEKYPIPAKGPEMWDDC